MTQTTPDAPPGVPSRLSGLVERTDPGAFAFVMATGIVSIGLEANGARAASAALLAVASAGYAALCAACAWRLLRWPARVLADVAGPRGFAFLTLVAASDVLASRFALGDRTAVAAALLAIGAASWLVLGYGVPLAVITGSGRSGLDAVNGTWLIWVVGTQSVAVSCATLALSGLAAPLAAAASVCWGAGLVLYVLITALLLARLLVRPVTPADLSPPLWVLMGAAAIGVLAGARLLLLPQGVVPVPRQAVLGLCLILWAFGTWCIPLLLGLGVWRHAWKRLPLRFETGLWSVAFPVGMYGVAMRELGGAAGISWLSAFGGGEIWVSAAVWLAVCAAMVVALCRRLLRG